MIYVAVVASLENEGISKRPYGDWASFIGKDRTKVIQRAVDAAKKWGDGYRVFAGHLVGEIVGEQLRPVHWPAELENIPF